jgi:hypothetical protein
VNVTCFYCGETVAEANAYRRVTGWERKAAGASRKGGSDVTLREPTGEHACMWCVDRLRRGVNVSQEQML